MAIIPQINILPLDDGNIPKGYLALDDYLLPSYPRGDFSSGKKLLASLGSFWASQFSGKGKLLALFKGSAFIYAQTYINWLETIAATSRFTIPIFHTKNWGIFVLKESEFDKGRASLYKFNGELIFDGTFKFGQRADNNIFEETLDQVTNISIIFNRILNPSIALVQGQDFIIDNNVLKLRINPFEDPRFTVRKIYDETGNVKDREVILWGFNVKEDHDYLYQHFGYILNKKISSSQGYKDFINSIWNALVGGLTIQDFEWCIAAVLNLPVVLENEEIVQKIIDYPDKKLVIVTNLHSYIYPKNSIPKIQEGDRVFSGQVLVDTIQIYDLSNYESIKDLITSPFIDDFGNYIALLNNLSSSVQDRPIQSYREPSKLLPPTDVEPNFKFLPLFVNLLNGNYSGPFIFKNTKSVIISSVDSSGNVLEKIKDVLGQENDLETFWQRVFNNGNAAGKVWTKYYSSLPNYINPAGWLIENFFKNNAIIIKLRYSKIEKILGFDFLSLLHLVFPPEKLIIILLDVELKDEENFDETQSCAFGSSSMSGDQCELTGTYSLNNEDNITIVDNGPIIYSVSDCLG